MCRLFLIFILVLIFVNICLSQSVKILPKKVEYQRTNPEIYESRRTFEITYPVITSRLKTSVRKKLKKNLSYWRIFKTPFQDHFEGGWTSSISYKTLYNQNNILALSFTWEGVGAYPDSSTEYRVISLKTGKSVGIKNIFERNSLGNLLVRIRKAIRIRENQTKKESSSCFAGTIDMYREAYPEFHPFPEKIKYKDLSGFFVTEKGVTFLYDYGFPHISEACEPEKEHFFSWVDLKPFIKRDSLLARFIR